MTQEIPHRDYAARHFSQPQICYALFVKTEVGSRLIRRSCYHRQQPSGDLVIGHMITENSYSARVNIRL